MLTPLLLAFRQIGDPAFWAPLLKGSLVALLAFLGLAGLSGWGAGELAGGSGWLAGIAATLSGLAALALAVWLFVPVMLAAMGLFLDPVAEAVERRFHPSLPPPRGAGLVAQARFGLALGLRLGLLSLVALPLALLLPPLGAALFFAINTIGLGHGLFEGVAQRRMGLAEAKALRRSREGPVLVLGAVLAAMTLVPVLNILVPVLGTAAMTHLLHRDSGGTLAEFRG